MAFETKFAAGDEYVSEVRHLHGIPDMASYEDMESKVVELLGSGNDLPVYYAITLVMNRRVNAHDPIREKLAFLKLSLTPIEKYLRLVIVAVELEHQQDRLMSNTFAKHPIAIIFPDEPDSVIDVGHYRIVPDNRGRWKSGFNFWMGFLAFPWRIRVIADAANEIEVGIWTLDQAREKALKMLNPKK